VDSIENMKGSGNLIECVDTKCKVVNGKGDNDQLAYYVDFIKSLIYCGSSKCSVVDDIELGLYISPSHDSERSIINCTSIECRYVTQNFVCASESDIGNAYYLVNALYLCIDPSSNDNRWMQVSIVRGDILIIMLSPVK
jgi:hypothetical protein